MAVRLGAAELYVRAVAAGNAGRHAAARRDLLAAREREPDPDTAALVAGTLAYLDSETGSPAEAIATIEEVLRDPQLAEQTRAVLTSQRGLLELRRGRDDDALRHLGDAIERLGDHPVALGRAHLNRGLVRLGRSDVDGAERDFARAAQAFARAGDAVEEAKAHSNEGYAAMLRGDLGRAIGTMDAAARVLGELSPVMRAVSDGDRAEALLAAGMTADAVALLEDAARIYGARRLRQAQAEAELLLARALLEEEPARAAQVASRAARRLRGRGNASWAVRADALVATGRLRAGTASAAHRDGARELARELEALHRRDDAALLRLELALDALARGDAADARALRHAAHPDADAPLAVQVRAAEVDAGLAAAGGDADALLASAAHGIETLTTWQASLGSLELHSGAAVHGRRLAVLGTRAALDRGDPQEVLDWSERVRRLSGSFPPLRPPADPEVATALTELRELQRSDASPATHARAAGLRDEVRRAHWADAARATRSSDAVVVDELGAALAADGAAFVTHLWTEEGLAALAIAPGTAPGGRIVELGRARVEELLGGLLADLDVAATTLPAVLRETVDTALARRLAELDALLLTPLGDVIAAADRLVLAPSGALAGVPWPMLPSVAGRPLVVAESARRWLDERRPPAAPRSVGFASGPGVTRARDELEAAAAVWPAEAREVRHDATAAEVTAVAERVDLLHIAAHGRHSAEHPLFSGFELADGPWFGYDIDQLARTPDAVVMSACELGRSASRWGLEALGMARAWLQSGARSVLAAPAAVGDEAASELLPAVHRELARGRGMADALSLATTATGLRTPFLARGSGW
ncbi:CHAT domain-containing protein [Protaetiibacter sp. SSC-01]|uniref:CHAT domain-containing protein n=1 Tax=Protaetiibacter sp. SSC-01 TaxID=2759943 RepID=UPI0016572D3B|nr:CHAT domain-containing protein [Protaetiibacter sp. SSC-01]QNO37242.1 CHAT domain-containing protein [Protaetiibacter sp. SSC-01]